jgi:DNA-binding transcriptional regulator GbsR (MarR family)
MNSVKSIKKQDQFIMSEKVIRHGLDPKTADVLATLIYKQKYWKKKGELSKWKEKECFFISLDDIEAETCYSNSIVAKCIKKLVAEGLVFKKRQGLNKPNLYSVDKTAVKAFKKSKITSFNKWQKAVRARSSSKKKDTERNIKNEESGILNLAEQEASKLSTTNNKNTNNKNTNNLTNRASSESEFELRKLFESLIEKFRYSEEELKKADLNSIFELLVKLVPAFQYFKMSESDKDLIIQMIESDLEPFNLFFKLYQNAEHIKRNEKEARFGNLFVGVSNMIGNYNNAVL